jgi:hypothetical protein
LLSHTKLKCDREGAKSAWRGSAATQKDFEPQSRREEKTEKKFRVRRTATLDFLFSGFSSLRLGVSAVQNLSRKTRNRAICLNKDAKKKETLRVFAVAF